MQTITRFSFLLLGGAALSAAADDPPAPPKKPNFSGRWKVDLDRSDFASLPAPRSLVRTIEQDPLHLTILVETVGRDGQQATGELRFALDGEDSVNEVNGSRVEGFARQLGSHVLLHTSRSVEGTRFERLAKPTRLEKPTRLAKPTFSSNNSNPCFEKPHLYFDKSNLSNCAFP